MIDWRYTFIKGASIFATATVFGFIAYDCRSDSKLEEDLYEEVLMRADMNKDGVTDENEWQQVYERLGIHYDSLNPQKLTVTDFQAYLDSESVEN